jgi:hypothetical protein
MFLITKKRWVLNYPKAFFYLTVLLLVALFSGCDTKEPETITVKETVIVEVPSMVIVTQPPEQIEIEVTRVVTKTVIITPTPVRTAVTTPTTTPTPSYFKPYPFGDYTGIPEIDDIARTILTRDTAAIRSLLHFQSLSCYPTNQDLGPYCRADEPVGTVIDVFSHGRCELFYTRDEEEIQSIVDELVVRVTGVYAVASDERTDSFGNAYTTYRIIFTAYQPSYALSVVVNSGNILSINLGCTQTPDEILYMRDVPIILPPISEIQNNN